jgi:hypothetical protein
MTEARGRADRQTEERTERRRRSDTTIDGGQRLKLAIPPEVQARLKAEGRTPRWVVKDSARMTQLTKRDDYDPVDGVEPVTTRNLSDGARVEMILLSKPTRFIEADKAKADEPRREVEKSFLRGKVPGESHGHDDRYSSGYVDEASNITHGGLGSP